MQSLFSAKDRNANRYFHKRAHYVAVLASAVDALTKKSGGEFAGVTVEYGLVDRDERRPVVVMTLPKGQSALIQTVRRLTFQRRRYQARNSNPPAPLYPSHSLPSELTVSLKVTPPSIRLDRAYASNLNFNLERHSSPRSPPLRKRSQNERRFILLSCCALAHLGRSKSTGYQGRWKLVCDIGTRFRRQRWRTGRCRWTKRDPQGSQGCRTRSDRLAAFESWLGVYWFVRQRPVSGLQLTPLQPRLTLRNCRRLANLKPQE